MADFRSADHNQISVRPGSEQHTIIFTTASASGLSPQCMHGRSIRSYASTYHLHYT